MRRTANWSRCPWMNSKISAFVRKRTGWLCSESVPLGRTSRSCRGFESHPVALALECLDRSAANAVGVSSFVVVRTWVAVGLLPLEYVIGGHEDGVGHGDHGFTMTPVRHDAAISRGERSLARPNSTGQRRLGQR